MQRIIVLLLIIAFLFIAYFLNIYSQKIINPKKSFVRLMLYFLTTVLMIVGLTYIMIFVIGRLYPQEIMK